MKRASRGLAAAFALLLAAGLVAIERAGGDRTGRSAAAAGAAYVNLPLAFEPNRGQADPSVRFLARAGGVSLLVRPLDATLVLPDRESLSLKLHGATRSASLVAEKPLPGTVNYLLGNDRSRWLKDLPTYGRVTARGVYPGVDLAYHGKSGTLEYDFVVSPGADLRRISMGFPGALGLRLDRDGSLVVELARGTLRELPPRVYQEVEGRRRPVPGRFVLDGGRAGFAVGPYDRSRTLVIDPSLSYSTYLGGTLADSANGIAVDSAGSAYVTGDTLSTDFPTTPGSYRPTFAGFGTEVFVTKLNAAGSALVYSTYLGGTSSETGYAIAVDSTGAAYVTGDVLSTDFPTTAGAFQGTRAVGPDAFVTKLNPAGDGLVYSTYLGGDDNDTGSGIAVEGSSAYLAGKTHSTDFPTASPYQAAPGPGGPDDAFVTKLNAAGTALDYSTYLGGTGDDYATGISVAAGLAHVTGTTASTDFPAVSALDGTKSGTNDAFVTKLNAAGSAPVYSTYLGGSGLEYGYGIAADSSGNAYVTGQTGSTDFPTTIGAYQTMADTLSGAFVTKLNAAGTALGYSTYLGGSGLDAGTAIGVDSAGTAYVLGATFSTDFPTASPHQASNGGGQDLFVSMLSPAGDLLTYSTYLGGGGFEYGNGIAVVSVGDAYVTGKTESGNFPTTTGAFQETSGGDDDAFVAKVGPGAPTAVALRSFTAARSGSGVLLRWRTATEVALLGFDVFRERAGQRVRLNAALILAASGPGGRGYSFRDRGDGRRYWLREVHSDGSHVWRGPVSVR